MRFMSKLSILGLSALLLSPVSVMVPVFGDGQALAKSEHSGKGGGGGNGHSKDNGQGGANKENGKATRASAKSTDVGSVSHGKIASDIKGLNAVHANPNALANANPNSQVGRIATYQQAALKNLDADEILAAAQQEAFDKQEALVAAQTDLQNLKDSYTGRTTAEIDDEIAGLDTSASDYQDRLDALNAEREAAAAQEAAVAEQQVAVDNATLDAEQAAKAAEEAAMSQTASAQAEQDALLAASNGRTLSPDALDYLRTQLGL